VVYKNTLGYASSHRKISFPVTKILLDEKYAFDSFQGLLLKDRLLVESLQVGASAMAERIAADFEAAGAAERGRCNQLM
jgi:hypothetical protein